MARHPVRRAILVEHVSTECLVAVRDPPPPMDDDTPKRRHIWGDTSRGHPGLIAWRRRDDGWEGYSDYAPALPGLGAFAGRPTRTQCRCRSVASGPAQGTGPVVV